MKAVSKTKTTKRNQGAGAWEKVPATSSLYRYLPNGKFYMLARIKGRLVRENLQTTDLGLAKRRVLATKDSRKNTAGERTVLQLAEDFKAMKNGKCGKAIDWMIKKLGENTAFSGQLVRKVNAVMVAKYVTSLQLEPRSNNLFFEML